MKKLVLFVAVDVHRARFGICAGEKLALWYGPFGKFDTQATTAEGMRVAAMKKAVWIGRKVSEGMGLRWRLNLELRADFELSRKEDFDLVTEGRWGKINVDRVLLATQANPAEVLVIAQDWCKPELARAARCVVEVPPIPSDR
jgi:hypothetical protein